MNNKLPIKEKNSLFGRIVKFFRKIFYKEKIEIDEEKNKPEIVKLKNDESEFKKDIKAKQHATDLEKEEFLDELEGNPKLLYNLSIEKLKILEEEYNKSISRQEEKLAKLRKVS